MFSCTAETKKLEEREEELDIQITSKESKIQEKERIIMELTKELEGLKNFTHDLDWKLKEYEGLDESAVKTKFDAAFKVYFHL